ncbi:protein-tyrosine phosphatase-like protein [Xylariomycetidae sp. FL0641]|nr:protein-tyrosine phosphatase-like protein [Xylariomycetidae sp. FL0641]
MGESNLDDINAIEEAPGLYVSGTTVARSPQLLRKHGITHVMSVVTDRQCPRYRPETGIRQLQIPVEDDSLENMLMYLDAACDWILDALFGTPGKPNPYRNAGPSPEDAAQDAEGHGPEQKGNQLDDNGQTSTSRPTDNPHPPGYNVRNPRVLVHCVMGRCRSVSIVTAYLMRQRGWDFERAFAAVKASRKYACVNSGFLDQLRFWAGKGARLVVVGPNGDVDFKPEYGRWKATRGVLMSRDQKKNEKREIRRMKDLIKSLSS